MDQIRTSLLAIDIHELLPKILDSRYAFACWKMPNEDKKQLVISLTDPVTIDTINDLDSGYLFNRFEDNHPKKPTHIKADLTFKENESPVISPFVNDQQLSDFMKNLGDPSIKKMTIESPQFSKASDYEMTVEKAIHEIKNGTFEKVVLSRFQDIDLADHFSTIDFFESICSAYTNAFCSLTHIPDQGVWIGASPELLISDNDERFKTAALAGTRKIDNDQPLSELAWTQKEIEEQALVSRYIINCFKKIRLREFDEHGPKTYKAGNLAHLRTEFEVNYSEVQFEGLADQMLDLLHPTSAVCGMPLEASKEFIRENENYDRAYYAGFLGPVNFERSTDLFVNLRCVHITNGSARFFAGAGITEDSNPQKEKVETDLKMQTLMSIFNT